MNANSIDYKLLISSRKNNIIKNIIQQYSRTPDILLGEKKYAKGWLYESTKIADDY